MRCAPSVGELSTVYIIAPWVCWGDVSSATKRWWRSRESSAVLSGSCCGRNAVTRHILFLYKRNGSRGTAFQTTGRRPNRKTKKTDTNQEGAALRWQITVANPRCLVALRLDLVPPKHASPRLLDQGCGELKECRKGLAERPDSPRISA